MSGAGTDAINSGAHGRAVLVQKSRRGLITAAILLGVVIFSTTIALPMPDAAIERLSPAALLTNGVPVFYFFLTFLLILRRSLSAALLTVFVCLAITLGNNFKFSIVSQPVVATDFIVFGQVLENPMLFEKYFREQWYLLPVLILLLALPFRAVRLERPLVTDMRWTAVSVAAGVLLLWQIQALLLRPQAPLQNLYASLLPAFDHRDPMTPVERNGLFATLINSAAGSYFNLPTIEPEDEALIRGLSGSVDTPVAVAAPRPDLIVIQNEAFFDFRILDAAFPSSSYELWDRLKRTARHGMATVDTYGGATLRTEFSLLTGIPASLFGAEMDYPYLTVVTAPIDSLPWHLKTLGYETIAIHPFHRTFWRRDQAYPRLGFDSFLSLSDFQDAEYDGPYVSDRAVCQKIDQLLSESDRPRFVFAVTMENHGPWSFDRGQSGTVEQIDTAGFGLPKDLDRQLKRYLYHARNAAAMASCLIDSLEDSGRPAALLVLGDHAPAMPAVFAAFGVENPWREQALRRVPYLLWQNWAAERGAVDTTVSELPATLLQVANLPLDNYLRMSSHLRQHCVQPGATVSQSAEYASCPDAPEAALLALARQRLHPLERFSHSPE